MTLRLVAAAWVVLVTGCSDEVSYTACWLDRELGPPPESTGVDFLDREKWRSYYRRGFLHCAEGRAYQVIQLGGSGEFANAAALKDCAYYWVPAFKDASSFYYREMDPSATADTLQKHVNEDVEKLLKDFSTQIEVFKLCYAKGIKSPNWH